jgi:hypothetical protein
MIMKATTYLILMLLIASQSCRKDDTSPSPGPTSLLLGSFKAKEVKEASQTVYADKSTTNIIPGYAKYRLRFSMPSLGVYSVKLVEYSGETFEGTWQYDPIRSILSLSNLNPRPASSDIVFTVEKLETGLLVLRNTTPSPKTGETINEYTLIPE